MIPLSKARLVAIARCWGLWRRWLIAEQANARYNGRMDRALLYRLWNHIRKEMEP